MRVLCFCLRCAGQEEEDRLEGERSSKLIDTRTVAERTEKRLKLMGPLWALWMVAVATLCAGAGISTPALTRLERSREASGRPAAPRASACRLLLVGGRSGATALRQGNGGEDEHVGGATACDIGARGEAIELLSGQECSCFGGQLHSGKLQCGRRSRDRWRPHWRDFSGAAVASAKLVLSSREWLPASKHGRRGCARFPNDEQRRISSAQCVISVLSQNTTK